MTITLDDIPNNVRSGYTETDGLVVPKPIGFWLIPEALDIGSTYFPIYGKKPKTLQIERTLETQGYVWIDNI